MGTTYHVHLSVRDAIHWPSRDLQGMFRDTATGRPLTADEARAFLRSELAKGHEKFPLDPDCEGFDAAGRGCPGHPTEGRP